MFNKNGAGWQPDFDSAFAVSNNGDNFIFKIPGAGFGTEVRYYIRASDAAGNTTTFPKHANSSLPYTTCYFAIGIIEEESRKISAWSFDNSVSISPVVNFPSVFSILEASVRIYLSHTWLNDLSLLTIFSPDADANNNRKTLYGRSYELNFPTPGGGIDGAAVSDNASLFWRDGIMPWTNGSHKPDHILRGLNGTNAQGDWKFIGWDTFGADPANFDSIRINLKKLDGTISPAARIDSPSDSIIDFGTISFPSQMDKDYYLYNAGNSNLTIDEINFTGEFSENFSVISSPLTNISPNDSGLITVRLDTESANNPNSPGNFILSGFENSVMEIETNDPSKPIVKVSLQSVNPLPVELAGFSSAVKGRDVELSWKTETEINAYKFEIERSKNISGDELIEYSKIGEVNASGNSNSPKLYSFKDNGLNTGIYLYRLKIIDNDGAIEYSEAIETNINIPVHFSLSPNYPNPFNPVTKIDYQLPLTSLIKLEVFSLTGEKIWEQTEDKKPAGFHTITIDLSLGSNGMASGIYIYKFTVIESGTNKITVNNRKFVLMK
jgi:hypothetical protein